MEDKKTNREKRRELRSKNERRRQREIKSVLLAAAIHSRGYQPKEIKLDFSRLPEGDRPENQRRNEVVKEGSKKTLFVSRKYGRLRKGYMPRGLDDRLGKGVIKVEKAPKELLKTQDCILTKTPLSPNVWSQHIFKFFSPKDFQSFANACHYTESLVRYHVNTKVRVPKAEALALFDRARENDGVKLDYGLLQRLCEGPFAYMFFGDLMLEDNPSWAIAAMSGDEKWLQFTYRHFIGVATKRHSNKRGILSYLAYAGQLDLIKKHFKGVLESERGKIANQRINWSAAVSGQFHVCDYLEKHFDVKPDEPYLDFGATVHFYAYYGEDKRLKKVLNEKPELTRLNREEGLLVHDAIRGGHSSTVKLLREKDEEALQNPTPTSKYSCLYVAAESGNMRVVKELLAEKMDPCEVADGKLIKLPIVGAGISGSWEIFRILVPYYKKHESFDQIMTLVARISVAYNRIDFFLKFIAVQGKECIDGIDSCGSTFEDYVILSGNMNAIRVLKARGGLDLTNINKHGDTPLLSAARCASRQESSDYSLWKTIAEIFKAYSSEYKQSLDEVPGKDGVTLRSLIVKHKMQWLFPSINFEREVGKQSGYGF